MNRVESGALSGVAAAVWADGEEPYYGGFGAASATTPISAQTILWIASMTRALTAVAAMQLVERKILTLDEPVGSYVPYLAAVQVLDRFETDGAPRLRDSKRPITLRHLLTHTSGFGYDFADADYLRFTRMLLGNGNLEGTTVLIAESVELMARSHTTAAVDGWQAVNPMMTNAVDLTASGPIGGGLSFLVNETPTAEGRSPGSLSWAGLANTYYWIDRRRRTTGVFATQVLPFYDAAALQTFRRFEATVDAVLPVDAV